MNPPTSTNDPLWTAVKYVTNAQGEKTDVLIPFTAWQAFLAVWQQALDHLEDQEDIASFRHWLTQREQNETTMLKLDDLEQELQADGLL